MTGLWPGYNIISINRSVRCQATYFLLVLITQVTSKSTNDKWTQMIISYQQCQHVSLSFCVCECVCVCERENPRQYQGCLETFLISQFWVSCVCCGSLVQWNQPDRFEGHTHWGSGEQSSALWFKWFSSPFKTLQDTNLNLLTLPFRSFFSPPFSFHFSFLIVTIHLICLDWKICSV